MDPWATLQLAWTIAGGSSNPAQPNATRIPRSRQAASHDAKAARQVTRPIAKGTRRHHPSVDSSIRKPSDESAARGRSARPFVAPTRPSRIAARTTLTSSAFGTARSWTDMALRRDVRIAVWASSRVDAEYAHPWGILQKRACVSRRKVADQSGKALLVEFRRVTASVARWLVMVDPELRGLLVQKPTDLLH